MKHNILVFPCGSEIGLEINRSLEFSTHFNVIGGSSVNDHGKFAYKNYIGDMPNIDAPDFSEKLNDIITKHKIDFIIPAHDSVVLKLAREKAEGRIACDVLTSPLETCEIARSKQKTYSIFKNILPTPQIFSSIEDIQPTSLPIFLKPDIGQGSKGTQYADNLEDIIFYTRKDPSLLMLEYLPGKEYTVDCFTNKEGRLLCNEGRERIRISNGISVNSSSVEDDRFEKLANIINETLEFRGAWFFQVKENSADELVLMEIAPRIAGTMGLIRSRGINLVLLSLFDALGQEVEVSENNYKIVIDRALENSYQHNLEYKHVYLDFDDLVIFEGKVNPCVMAFVYQCINKNIKVHLLTRHKNDLHETLKKYRLENTFDELLWVRNGNDKHLQIKNTDAILIDDSFAERKQVRDKLGIPVFDGHMIEALMEKF